MRTVGSAGRFSRHRTPTLERELELGSIREVLVDALAGRGQLLVVEGPGGIGKSRLLGEAAAHARASDMEVLHARGGELERGYPFGVLVRMLESRFARAPAVEQERLFRGRAALAAPLLGRSSDDVHHASTTDEFAWQTPTPVSGVAAATRRVAVK